MKRTIAIVTVGSSLCLFASVGSSGPVPSNTLFVDADAPAGGNGYSWGGALQDLQPAIQLAYFSGGTITEIWVAEGTYKPTAYPPGGGGSKTFWMVDGLSMYGGFAGTETSVDQRDIAAHPTILSGDLNGDDDGTPGSLTDNAYHVLLNSEDDFSFRLDGFEVTGGNAVGVQALDQDGGGVKTWKTTSFVLSGCWIHHNHATNFGGGVHIDGPITAPTTLLIEDCSIEWNSAGLGAAGVAADTGNATSFIEVTDSAFRWNHSEENVGGADLRQWLGHAPVVVKRCTFLGNTGGVGTYAGGGGGLRVSGLVTVADCIFAGTQSIGGIGGGLYAVHQASITQCIFSGNRASEGGGLLLGAGPDTPRFDVDGCSFTGNQAVSEGGAIHIFHSDNVTITNSILWDNLASTDPEVGADAGYAPVIQYSDVKGGWVGTGNIDADPLFVDPLGPDGIAGTLDDDLSLSPGSPCVDAGSNSALLEDVADLDEDGDTTEPTPLDSAGEVRRTDDPGTVDTGEGTSPIVDLGALELPGGCGSVSGYCATSPNSVGPGALISHAGSASVSAADLVLQAASCPLNQFGLFYYGQAQLSLPFGNGLRCVGGGGHGIYRFAPVQTDGFGFVSMPVDFGTPPAGSGPGALLAYGNWNFQFWYRDPAGGGAQFNLSDALNVLFCP